MQEIAGQPPLHIVYEGPRPEQGHGQEGLGQIDEVARVAVVGAALALEEPDLRRQAAVAPIDGVHHIPGREGGVVGVGARQNDRVSAFVHVDSH